MIDLIEDIAFKGDTIRVITCVIKGVPVGWVFGKLRRTGCSHAEHQCRKGFEYGDGFDVNHRGQ